ncbi:aspartate-semialdehyde dehydrogenase [Pseudoroseomonas cervicalis]|uniref:aspartate-semialdehyde dehydrogenase n=1 Tax=Teichococcus cervicalis TaxID=204525 RepID=UPI00278B3232|nr:aspartate-semialdehyde dehydrogenase [Pseudoroseomonas cervicalis]MDQ1080465.1 aspartate-semialdehyde dehydrogenase [Pseudoroseomonas cervicalis]
MNALPSSAELAPPSHQSVAANPVVAIVGATGAVGVEMLRSLEERDFPLASLKLLASPRSAGKTMRFRGQDLAIEALDESSFEGVDLALFSAGSGVSKRYAAAAVKAGAVVVDNSSAFRMDPDVPLVVPEVNGAEIARHRGIIANPNCVAIIATVPLWPLQQAIGIRRVTAATYQAASGAGAAAMEELRASTEAYLKGEAFTPQVLPHPYAFNLFSHNAEVDPESGYNGEELKVIAETRRIMDAPSLPLGITCIRVPILRAHAIALNVEFNRPVSPDEVKALLAEAPGVRIVDDRVANHFPMPSEASGQGDVLAGRFRADLGDPSGHSVAFFVAGDQLLKGAALNAVQIAEQLLAR